MAKEMMKQGRHWLRLVRGEGDADTKREYLREKGFTKEELEELLEWDRLDAQGQTPMFS